MDDIHETFEDLLDMLPDDIKEVIEMFIDYIKDNYIYIFIIIILIITIFIFYDNIYDYINNIFSNAAVEKKKIEVFNQISVENDISENNLLNKNTYDPLFKNNINLYKENLTTRLSYIKNNIDNSINKELSQSNPNYRLISFMKKYKDKLDSIDIERKFDPLAIEKDLEDINKKIITLLLN